MARNATIDHVVYDGIHRAILEQRLPPGTKLGEESLSSLFDVSRARVRRILLRLAHDKSVKLRPNRGAYVAQSCCACDEHRALLAELEAGRVQDAVDLMTRHLQRIEGRLNLDRTPRTPVDLRDVFGKPPRNGLAS